MARVMCCLTEGNYLPPETDHLIKKDSRSSVPLPLTLPEDQVKNRLPLHLVSSSFTTKGPSCCVYI